MPTAATLTADRQPMVTETVSQRRRKTGNESNGYSNNNGYNRMINLLVF
jgi:hypothetical protein